MKKLILGCALLFVLAGCELTPPSISVDDVTFDWSNIHFEDILFTVTNDGEVDIDEISLYFTKTCVGGTFEDIAGFPNIYDMDYPLWPGNTALVVASYSTTTGGCLSILVTKAIVTDSYGDDTTIPLNVTFTAP
jgi:hypothetical protein